MQIPDPECGRDLPYLLRRLEVVALGDAAETT
jgi:hypothetical protein